MEKENVGECALIYGAKNVCSTPKMLAKEMDLPCTVKNNYPEWMIKKPEM